MTRFLLFVSLVPVAFWAQAASAQQQGNDACHRDVVRHCRAVMNDGDSAVLSCLQQNCSRISKACERIMAEHGK